MKYIQGKKTKFQ